MGPWTLSIIYMVGACETGRVVLSVDFVMAMLGEGVWEG